MIDFKQVWEDSCPEGWYTPFYIAKHSDKKLATEFVIWIQLQDTDWVVIDENGVIDAPLLLRADWEFSDEQVHEDVEGSNDLNKHIANLMYRQIQLDIDDLILNGPGGSRNIGFVDPLLINGENRSFIPREKARKMLQTATHYLDKVHANSNFRDEKWFKNN